MVSFRADGESFGSSLVSQIDPIESTRSRARPGFCIDVISKRADDRSKIGAGGDKHPFCRLDARIEAAYPPGSNSA
jgi:hypothetical protein